MTALSNIERRMLTLLRLHDGERPSWLGERLWAKDHTHLPAHCSCPFARPAGAVLHRLRRRGLAVRNTDGWRITAAGALLLEQI